MAKNYHATAKEKKTETELGTVFLMLYPMRQRRKKKEEINGVDWRPPKKNVL